MGGARHRGPARRPRRDVHQDAPRADRRRLLDAADAERAVAPTRTSAAWRRPGPPSTPRAVPAGAPSPSTAAGPPARCAALGPRPSARRRPGCPAPWSGRSSRGVRNETSAVSLYAPRTIINKRITGSRRFAAQDWPLERLRAIGKATRYDAQRRRARDVQRRDAHLPRRARRAAGHVPGRDGAGGPQGQELAERVRSGGNAVGRGDGQARHGPGRPRRPAAAVHRSMVDRQGGARRA